MTPLFAANVLQPLIDVAHAVLRFFHDQAGLSWGVSIIALTFVVRLLILPLTFKQVRGMQQMQRHAPELKKLTDRYKDDPKRKQEEMMRFYQENQFNPLSSCLPLILQIPFFITLFYLLRSDAFRLDIRGEESFGFIPNLAQPLMDHPMVLILMLVLYVGTQLGATLVTAVSADRNQRLLMLGLPFLFVFFIINFEAGLMVYWITTNVWTIGQQLFVKKFLPAPDPAAASADTAVSEGDRADSGRGARRARATRAVTNGAKGTEHRPSSSNGGGNGAAAKPRPGTPRKKKKRSGRRR